MHKFCACFSDASPKYSNKLAPKVVDDQVKAAMDMWEGATNLKFIKKDSGKADIEIKFVYGVHGDDPRDPFDGRGETLAHAYFPITGGRRDIDGDIHMDDDENGHQWSPGCEERKYSYPPTPEEFDKTDESQL